MIIRAILRFIFRRTANTIASRRVLPRRTMRNGREIQLPGTRQQWLGYILSFIATYLAFLFLSVLLSSGKHTLAIVIANLALVLLLAAVAVFAWRYLISVAYWEDDDSFTKTNWFGKERTVKYADITYWTMIQRYNSYYLRMKTADKRFIIVSYAIYRTPLLLLALMERERAGDFEQHPIKREARLARLIAEYDTQLLALEREEEKTGRDLLSAYPWVSFLGVDVPDSGASDSDGSDSDSLDSDASDSSEPSDTDGSDSDGFAPDGSSADDSPENSADSSS